MSFLLRWVSESLDPRPFQVGSRIGTGDPLRAPRERTCSQYSVSPAQSSQTPACSCLARGAGQHSLTGGRWRRLVATAENPDAGRSGMTVRCLRTRAQNPRGQASATLFGPVVWCAYWHCVHREHAVLESAPTGSESRWGIMMQRYAQVRANLEHEMFWSGGMHSDDESDPVSLSVHEVVSVGSCCKGP